MGSRIVVFGSNGSAYRVVVPQGLGVLGYPDISQGVAWSPRGDRLVFEHTLQVSDCPEFEGTELAGAPCYRRELAVMRADGSEARSLYRPPQADHRVREVLPPGSPFRKLPYLVLEPFAWHGDRIFMTAIENDSIRIAAVGDDGSGFRFLMPKMRYLASPALSPDGKWIAFLSARGVVQVMRSTGGPIRTVKVRSPLRSRECSPGPTCNWGNVVFDRLTW